MSNRSMSLMGWTCLIIAFIFYYIDSPTSTIGRLFNGGALGFFGNVLYNNIKEGKKK